MSEPNIVHQLKWAEMMWMYKTYDSNDSWAIPKKIKLAEAGNSNYHPNNQAHAIREGDVVLVVGCRKSEENFIPASTVVKGFYPEELNGKTLGEIMEEGVIYDHMLRPVV